ncbi:MAG: ABC transporter ATP-binding protein [Candidatus Cloacimonetes bacterium]|nr:ABC transporter ATP-binding protein [Candidatus Cloacimonadota bacterium]
MRQFMHGTEDDLKSRIYDKELFRRLIAYLKPYLLLVVISFLLLMMIAAAELAMPYVTKLAVDEVITSNQNLIIFDDSNDAEDFRERYSRVRFKQFEYEDRIYFLFSNTRMNYFAPEEIAELENQARFEKKIALLENKESIKKLLGDDNFLVISADQIAVQTDVMQELRDSGILSAGELRSIRSKDLHKLKIFGMIFFGIVVIQFILTYFQIYTINYAAQHAMYDLRMDLFQRLEKMPLSFFDKNPVGRLVTRITNDIRALDEMLSAGLIKLIQDILVMIGILVMMFILNWKLALVTYAILPFLIILLIVFKNKIRVVYRVVRKKIAAINATLSEDISGVKIIQIFNQYNRKKREFSRINNEYYQASLKQMRIYASFRPVIHSTRRIALALILWYGGGQIMQNLLTLGVFMAFFSYMDRFFEPIDQLSEKFNILQAAMSGAERIFDLKDKPIEDYQLEKKTGNRFRGEIEFRNVWLRYNDHEDVLKNISFKIKSGEKVALVGHTGSGKTSIISLISGLYPFQKGEILIDGKSIRDYSLQDLRRNIGIVQQDVFLFTGTIRDNIALNNSLIEDKEIRQVSRYVNVDEFIDSLPQQYEEPVMERGATFSVGQRQLIAFARVLAYDPAIFVLDEATSNIDTETEILIQDALKKLMENRTSIIIAHRLSTIQHVDRIIVMHKGEIREEGSHQELLAKEGLYYDLYRLQYT